jgi:hypothetical protein
MPNGHRLTLRHILQWRADLIDGRFDLTGKWAGWRVRQQWLIPPGGSVRQYRIAQHVLAYEIRDRDWQRKELNRKQLSLF